MKHRELIIAAMDGKIIQYKVENGSWHILTQEHAVYSLAVYPDSREYRIKPGPIPDKVQWGVISCDPHDEKRMRRLLARNIERKPTYSHVVKLTTKTDDNDVVTEHVEIVK